MTEQPNSVADWRLAKASTKNAKRSNVQGWTSSDSLMDTFVASPLLPVKAECVPDGSGQESMSPAGPLAAVDPFGSVLARYRRGDPEPVRRKPGRPVKRTPEYFAVLLAKHKELEARYVAEHGAAPESVKSLYTAYFAELFTARGERASRASSADFQGALKTLRNELAVARRLSVSRPKN
jgi:hypothetical protein